MTYYSSPEVGTWQHQIILGTILGGSTIVKPPKGINCYLFMRSSNHDWLKYKSEELVAFSSQQPITKDGNTLRWHSNCFPIFNEYRKVFYDGNNKKISMEVLDQLKDTALAVWFGDCGRIKNGRVIINTCKFREKGSRLIAQYMNEAGLDSEASLFIERNNYRVLLSKAGTEKFLMTIGHRLPEFMIRDLNI
jgi:hypothetical protein